ncbi:MAG: hypothetical protein ABIH39_05620 [Candidatus Margulisiibacteriota bacterium]
MKNNIRTWFLLVLYGIGSVYFFLEAVSFFPNDILISLITLMYFVFTFLGLLTKVNSAVPSVFLPIGVVSNVLASAAWIFLLTSLCEGDAKIRTLMELIVVIAVFVSYVLTLKELKVFELFKPPRWLIEDVAVLTAFYFFLNEMWSGGRSNFFQGLLLMLLTIITFLTWVTFLITGFNKKSKVTQNQ